MTRKFWIVLALAALMAALCLGAGAESGGKCGETVFWSLSADGKTLTILGSGEMADYDMPDDVPWHGECAGITRAVVGEGITRIGNLAFVECGSMTGVSLPDSLTAIGDHAFDYCYDLEEVSLPGSLTDIGACAFRFCESLTEILFPEGLTELGPQAFAHCTALKAIHLPESVAHVSYLAFGDCQALTVAAVLNPEAKIGDGDLDVFIGCPAGLVLRGQAGSTLEAYAAAAGIAFEALD